MIKVKKGQALILILLVMAISLTLGVSVASRSITTLKQVSFSAQSAQALAFAEGGIEEALKCLDDGSCAVPSDPAAVDLAAIYLEAGVYKVLRYAYDPDASRASENGFFTPFTGGFSVNGVTYAYRVSISVPFTPIALRIRPLYSTTASSFVFSAETGRTLPTTGSRIESTGTSGSVQRKIEVLRTNSSLSELFDFALFSGSETSPLSK